MRILPDAEVPSREELEAYWRSVHVRALKHMGQRPLTLVRHLHAITLFHKGLLALIPDAVHCLELKKSTGEPGVRVVAARG